MDKRQFINTFVAQFLAKYTYDVIIKVGRVTTSKQSAAMLNDLPVIQAHNFALRAWTKYHELMHAIDI